MPKPKTKTALLNASQESYAELNAIVDALSPAQRDSTFPFAHRDRNIRDVVAHLYAWQKLMLGWYETGKNGDKPPMPAEGFTWRMTPELNATIWEKYQNTSLTQIRKMLESSHKSLHHLIEEHAENELFTRGFFPWTGTTSLGAYFTSALSSHYLWAIKLIRRYSKTVQ